MIKRTWLTLAAGAAVLMGVGASVWSIGPAAAQDMHLPSNTDDLSNAAVIEVKDGSGAVVLRGQFIEQPENDDDLERKAQLVGSGAMASASGMAEVEVSGRDNRLEQEVEVEVLNLTPGAAYSVVIDSKPLGTLQTDEDGRGSLELTTPPVAQP